jgi:hypothetical protein
MKSGISVALLSLLTLIFLGGETNAASLDQRSQVTPAQSWNDDTGLADATAADISDTDEWVEFSNASDPAKLDVASIPDQPNADSDRAGSGRSATGPADHSLMRLAASTMSAEFFRTGDRHAFKTVSSSVVRVPTALSLLTICLVVLALFEHRRRQP